MIFSSEKHYAIYDTNWDTKQVEACIESIFNYVINNFDSKIFWPSHPAEDSDIECNKSVYFGASGTLWGTDVIARYLGRSLPFDKANLIEQIYNKYMETPDTKEVVPSLFLGEVGILLIKQKFQPTLNDTERLFKLIQENKKNETMEALWGAPGTMIGASYLYEWTKDELWANLFRENAEYLIKELRLAVSRNEKIWTQRMYGKTRRFVGAGHGYFGNIFGILKKLELLSQKDQDFILSNIFTTMKDLSCEEDGVVSWPTLYPSNEEIKPFVQWCHGSAGIITSLKLYPSNYREEVESLLLKAGELVWKAGPLKKGIALCHGTDGNGYAFLQLYKRTGDKLWLDRARKFAMHAIGQRNNRFTLFTGEIGLALYLISCIKEEDDFPFLDSI